VAQISREVFVNVGGSVGFSLSDAIDLFGGYTVTVMGCNRHATNRGFAINVDDKRKRATLGVLLGKSDGLPSRDRDAALLPRLTR
jgi:hypothetical protein